MNAGANRYRSWGFAKGPRQSARVPHWIESVCVASGPCTPLRGDTSLAFGRGRSYGDSCLNSDGELIDTRRLDRLLAFDRRNGVLRAEPGITLGNLLRVIVPCGWFLPVTPGTAHVTLGGAIANDVHGKNHHADGSFGRFVERFVLLRSDGARLDCSPTECTDLYRATIGGLGLTGFIAEATIRLMPIRSDRLDVRTETFQGLDAFTELSERYGRTHRYTVAWLDCAASGRGFARGAFFAANHVDEDGPLAPVRHRNRPGLPFALPSRLLNRQSLRAFNAVYAARQRRRAGGDRREHYHGFFYPLDALENWNRIYGRGGFHQYQFVVPADNATVLEPILRRVVDSGLGSFLAVLKVFGELTSPGMLSFPRAGPCLALDFANRGPRTEALIESLDEQVMAAGGAAYPAKDRLMTARAFRRYFPACDDFARHVDPHFSSDFWRRVSA